MRLRCGKQANKEAGDTCTKPVSYLFLTASFQSDDALIVVKSSKSGVKGVFASYCKMITRVQYDHISIFLTAQTAVLRVALNCEDDERKKGANKHGLMSHRDSGSRLCYELYFVFSYKIYN